VRAIHSILLAGVLTTGACAQTRYVELPAGPDASDAAPPHTRTVEYRQDETLLTRPPACLLLVGTGTERIAPELAALIEQSLTRHLMQRAHRVLAGEARAREARRFGVAAVDAASAPYLAARAGCDGIVEYEIAEAEARYLVFYTRFAMTLDLRARRVAGGGELWRARHAGAASAGGPPTSLASVLSAWSATELAGDGEAVENLVEAVVRRLMATWPVAKRPA